MISHKNVNTILISIAILLVANMATAATLAWDPSSGTVDGYKVYYGTSSSAPSNSVEVGNTTQYSLDQLALAENTQYFFSVSAYNTAGESDPCPPVAYTPADTTPPLPPAGLVAE